MRTCAGISDSVLSGLRFIGLRVQALGFRAWDWISEFYRACPGPEPPSSYAVGFRMLQKGALINRTRFRGP